MFIILFFLDFAKAKVHDLKAQKKPREIVGPEF